MEEKKLYAKGTGLGFWVRSFFCNFLKHIFNGIAIVPKITVTCTKNLCMAKNPFPTVSSPSRHFSILIKYLTTAIPLMPHFYLPTPHKSLTSPTALPSPSSRFWEHLTRVPPTHAKSLFPNPNTWQRQIVQFANKHQSKLYHKKINRSEKQQKFQRSRTCACLPVL